MNTVTYLQQLSRRRRAHTAVLAALILLGAAILAFLAIAGWDVVRPLPPGSRAILRILVPAALGVLGLLVVFRRAARFTTAHSAAALENLNPGLGQQVRTALEITASGIPAKSSPE